MAIACPKCKREVQDFDVDASGAIVFCRRCNLRSDISKLSENNELDQIDLSRPPEGAWHRDNGASVVVGATHKAIKSALGLLPYALFWNAIVTFFVVFAVSGTLYVMHLPRPSFFPEPIMNNRPMAPWPLLGLWLFLTPFILIGGAFILGFFSLLAGRTELTIDWRRGVLFSGLKNLGRRRAFNPELVKDVRVEDRNWRGKNGEWNEERMIVIETEGARKPIRFGSQLSPERLRFIAAVLRKHLLKGRR